MELTIDYLVGFTFLTIILVLSWYLITTNLVSQPIMVFKPRVYEYPIHLIISRDGNSLIVTCKEGIIVKVTIVAFKGNEFVIVKGNTPLRLSLYDFIVAFSGFSIAYYGNPPQIRAYITPYGVYGSPVSPPYVRIDNGRIVEVNPSEHGTSLFGYRKLTVINEVIMIGKI